jgi:hypothetical protein
VKRVESEAAEEYNDSVWKSLRLHRQVDTVRGMNMVYETGLFDVSYVAGRRAFDAFSGSTWSWGVSWLSTTARKAPSAVACSALRRKVSTRPPAQKPWRINIEDVKPTDHA